MIRAPRPDVEAPGRDLTPAPQERRACPKPLYQKSLLLTRLGCSNHRSISMKSTMSRRQALTAAAALATTSTATLPVIAAAAPDPIYAAIERSRKAERALDSLGENATNGERTTAIDEATDARWDLASTVATTPAGLTALTAFICEEEKDLGEAGPFFDSDQSKVFAESLNRAVSG